LYAKKNDSLMASESDRVCCAPQLWLSIEKMRLDAAKDGCTQTTNLHAFHQVVKFCAQIQLDL
jgi:hypothetical protein